MRSATARARHAGVTGAGGATRGDAAGVDRIDADVLISHMSTQHWIDLGRRIAHARSLARLSQEQVADALGIDRTAVTKIEAGARKVDTFEIGRLASVLGRSVDWLLSPPRPALISRRASGTTRDARLDGAATALLEEIAQGVELLQQLHLLDVPDLGKGAPIASVGDAEQAALRVRAKLPHGPLRSLATQLESLGLFAFTLRLDEPVEGLYLALERGGVALVNGGLDSGRRRFTLAHELGHHVLADEYSADFDVSAGIDERERLTNAFAIHLLMPREEVSARYHEARTAHGPRGAAVVVSCEYGVSWSAARAHLRNLGLLTRDEFELLEREPPRRADYLELGLAVTDEALPPQVPPRYAAAVIRAYRRHDLSAPKAIELLRGTLAEEELPAWPSPPLSALAGA